MTTDQGDNATLTIPRGIWVRLAMDIAERWLEARGERTSDMEHFANHVRELRYFGDHRLEDLAAEVQMPYHTLALLEQGLARPSEVPDGTWVRLMRILEGRDPLTERALADAVSRSAGPQQDGEDEPPETPADPDEAWANEDAENAAGPVEPPAARPPAPARSSKAVDNIGVARIKVVGVGGGGTNAVARMFKQRIPGVEYVAINTDAQHLIHLDLPVKLRVGDKLTRGLGVGGNPEIGHEAALESREDIRDLLSGTDLVFIAAGMGGGTGTGAAPVVAEIAKEVGALTIAAVTKPFSFEGHKRKMQADEGISRLRPKVDTLIVIPNDRLSSLSDERMTAENAFRLADDVLRQGVQSIAELITVPGEINLDFADVKTVMAGSGPAWMAIGYGRGENRALEAARAAMASPLLDVPIEGATKVLLNITGGTDMTIQEVQQAADYVGRLVDPEANIIFGMVTDTKMEDEVRVIVVATGIQTGEDLLRESLEEMVDVEAEFEAEEPERTTPPPRRSEGGGFLRRLGFGRRSERE